MTFAGVSGGGPLKIKYYENVVDCTPSVFTATVHVVFISVPVCAFFGFVHKIGFCAYCVDKTEEKNTKSRNCTGNNSLTVIYNCIETRSRAYYVIS